MQVLFKAASLSYQLMNAKASVAQNLAFAVVLLTTLTGRFSVILSNVPNILYLPSIQDWRAQRHLFALEFIS